MARPLRIERSAGRYHITARGNERKDLFRDDPDRFHFLELLAELSARFGCRVHAYVLMDNHFHLLLETPEANLSRAMQWLLVSFSVWFNRRHRRVGHLFQGRFKAIVVEDDRGWQEVARYVHLNPVRVGALKLSKSQQAASKQGLAETPQAELVAQRLKLLREYRWSSYRGYAGYGACLDWVWREPLAGLCGGQRESQQQAAVRQYTEQAVRQGLAEQPWERLVAGTVLGTREFAERLFRQTRGSARERKPLRSLEKALPWSKIVQALERIKGERWAEFCERHGDWGRDAALWLGRREGRLRLAELGKLAGGADYAAVAQGISRFGKRLKKDPALQRAIKRLQHELSNI